MGFIVTSGKPDTEANRHYIMRQDGPTLGERGGETYICRCNCGHVWIGRGRSTQEAYDAAEKGFNEHTAKIAGVVNRQHNAGIPETPRWWHKYKILSYPIRSSKVTGNWNRV